MIHCAQTAHRLSSSHSVSNVAELWLVHWIMWHHPVHLSLAYLNQSGKAQKNNTEMCHVKWTFTEEGRGGLYVFRVIHSLISSVHNDGFYSHYTSFFILHMDLLFILYMLMYHSYNTQNEINNENTWLLQYLCLIHNVECTYC